MASNHFHKQYELYYLISGERYFFIKDKIFHIQPGSLVLINKNDLHKTIDAGAKTHTRFVVNFSETLLLSSSYMNNLILKLLKNNNNVITFLPAEQQYIETLLNKMVLEIQNKPEAFEVSLQIILMEILIYAARYVKEHQTNTIINPSPVHQQISEIIQYINNNFSTNLSLPSVSKKFFISQYYLSRTFKEVTGFTFVEYVNSIRIREAQRLLQETDYKVIHISEKIGFGNISHFGRVFKKITGLSPLSYRKLYNKN